jgi:hypothetical protein
MCALRHRNKSPCGDLSSTVRSLDFWMSRHAHYLLYLRIGAKLRRATPVKIDAQGLA